MKRIQALIAALVVTVLVAFGMGVLGMSVFLNPNGVAPSNSPNDPPAAVASTTSQGATSTTSDPTQAQVDQLKAQVAQYQARDQQLTDLVNQYQAREKQYQTELSQSQNEVQQLQNVLVQLQNAGIIQVGNDGTIQVFGGRRRFGNDD